MLNQSEQDLQIIGGKAANLKILSENNISVPRFCVITTDVFKRFIEENDVFNKIDDILSGVDFKNKKQLEQASFEIKKIFVDKKISEKDKSKIFESFKKIKKETKSKFFSVRSSAVSEDNRKQSFAGQMDSFLFVSRKEELIKSVKKCWASIYSERAIVYRNISNMDLLNFPIAVIIQEMIHGDKSGVMFTVNPLSNEDSKIYINSTFGTGEGVVSGELNTDTFIFNKENNSIKKEIKKKQHKIVFNKKKGFGTAKKIIEKQKQYQSSLTESEIKSLSDIGKKIEKIYSFPQDIEWTIKKNKIYILQTRPITTYNRKTKQSVSDEKIILWDNSNIIESFPGVTKPLTFSFAKTAWAEVFRQTALAMGVSKETVEENDELFENMLGLVHGRVYYNLMKWYRFVSFFPGFKNNKKYMEQMMGVKKTLNMEGKTPENQIKKTVDSLPGYTKLSLGLIKNYLTLDEDIKKFYRNFNYNYNRLEEIDFEEKTPFEVMKIYFEAKNKLLKGWKVEGINDYSAMFFYGLVRKLSKKYNLDEYQTLHNDLFCGEKDMDSTKPTKKLVSLSNQVKNNNKLYSLFSEKKEEKILEEIKKTEYKNFYNDFKKYLDEYGFRCMNELKLEEKTLKDDPTFIIKIIKNYLKQPDLNLEKINEKEKYKRKKAEEIVNKKLKGHPFRKLYFNWALRNARKSVRYRENLRLCRTKVFGILRETFNSIALNFQEKQVIDKTYDIFYLEIDEIFDYIKNCKTRDDLRKIIRKRKKIYQDFEKENLPERFKTKKDFKKYSSVEIIKKEERKVTSENILKGVSCCPGIVEGKARVILSPQDDVNLDGEILVAEKTDPGWVPLYPSVSGLLIERGSVLSHSAIVAREIGLPTIVGVKNLIENIKDGQKIKMDATEGLIYLKPQKKLEAKK